MRHQSRNNRGFTLLEVLVSVLIFSLGLMGMAGLMVVSVKTNQGAYLRTQASFVAQAMTDRIRMNRAANPTSYNGTYDASSVGSDPCASGASCSASNVVLHDTRIWSQQLVDSLPNPSATVTCAGAMLDTTITAPFNGQCTVTISWDEANLDRGTKTSAGNASPTRQTFAWVYQP